MTKAATLTKPPPLPEWLEGAGDLLLQAAFRNLPATPEVLSTILGDGIIVGSWPYIHRKAKDVDVVVRGRSPDDRHNPLFQRIKERFQIESEFVGHVWVQAWPQPVEFFENDLFSFYFRAKGKTILSFRQAAKRSRIIRCYGIPIRAVCEEEQP